MAQLQIAYLLRSGTQEQWRRLCQEIAGSRKGQFEDGKARAAQRGWEYLRWLVSIAIA
jgi:hypothetical protein